MSETPEKTLVLALPDDAARRLDKALATAAPAGAGLSRTRITRLIRSGAVSRRQDGVIVTEPGASCRPGDVWIIKVQDPPAPSTQPQPMELDIVHEDKDLLVVNKPAAMTVHPAPGSPEGTLLNGLLHHCSDGLANTGDPLRPGIVHRIDRNTSGLLVVAKTAVAEIDLARQFAERSVERLYVGFCHDVPEPSNPRLVGLPGVAREAGNVFRIATRFGRHRTDRKKMSVFTHGGRHAVTRFRVERVFRIRDRPVASRIACWLETGRTHQIRVHMHHIGHPLIGDPTYGGGRRIRLDQDASFDQTRATGISRQALHAAVLGFDHPRHGERMRFDSALPADLRSLEMSLAGGAGFSDKLM
ncbi:MAG: RluA family pseudouridine synthase [Paracoccaceae bacterium]|nr:RluA family pseudouridine synthase [Paracoccaceae bacterium]